MRIQRWILTTLCREDYGFEGPDLVRFRPMDACSWPNKTRKIRVMVLEYDEIEEIEEEKLIHVDGKLFVERNDILVRVKPLPDLHKVIFSVDSLLLFPLTSDALDVGRSGMPQSYKTRIKK